MNVRCDGVCADGQGIEVAVRAFFNTERDVDVETLQLIPPNDEIHSATLEYLVYSLNSAR